MQLLQKISPNEAVRAKVFLLELLFSELTPEAFFSVSVIPCIG